MSMVMVALNTSKIDAQSLMLSVQAQAIFRRDRALIDL